MNDTQSQTESLLEIVRGIQNQAIMLPEFQRDFRWELDQTYDLFDSLIRDIFIGTIIYGKPSFGMTLREIDRRPRKGKGANAALQTTSLSTQEIVRLAQTKNLRIVLDGQQRITSIYRAIVGLDNVYIILRDHLNPTTIGQVSLEEMVDRVAGEESAHAISVKLADSYDAEIQVLEDDDLAERFAKTVYGQRFTDEAEQKAAARIYRRAVRKLIDLFKQQKMVAFYLLDMHLDKFCLFFERSNSRGIQLNFTDILAAKLYHGFNLRKKIDEFESQNVFRLNREIIVRAIAYICGTEQGGTISIDKKAILENLEASDFTRHWDAVCRLYVDGLQYLAQQHYILSQSWMPSENMIVPLMMFLRTIKGFERMSEEQRAFLEYWYWASIFSNRYSTASNEVIITDSQVLSQVARGEAITARGYFQRMRSLITEPEDLFSYTKRTSALYRGILNLLSYASHGLRDWNNTQLINVALTLEDHHIYPRAYIASRPALDIDQAEAEQLVDCVVNRTLIPKITNIQLGKKAPHAYLSELQQRNDKLSECLAVHCIPSTMINELTWSGCFKLFLDERAQQLFDMIERYAMKPASDVAAQFSSGVDASVTMDAKARDRVRDMLADGRIRIGDRIFTRRWPDRFATIVDADTVEFEGQRLSMNIWGQQMTGWQSINIYTSVLLERTGRPIGQLRAEG